jgi:hypothetical protein
LLFAPVTPVRATTFNPQFDVTLSSTALGANPDVTVNFNLPAPSANFSTQPGHLVTFADSNVQIASASAIPGVGAYIGSLSAVWQLGLANEGCKTQVPVTFDFVDAEVSPAAKSFTPVPMTAAAIVGPGDTAITYTHPGDPLGVRQGDGAAVNEIRIDFEEMLVTGGDPSTNTLTVVRGWNGTTAASHTPVSEIKRVNVIYPAGPPGNLLANFAEDDGDLDNNGTVEHSELAGDGIPDGAEAVPSFVRNSFDPDGNPQNGGYIQPLARYFGTAFVANSLVAVYQIVTASPGALSSFPDMSWMTASWGYPALTFLQDPTGPPSNSAVTDFCNFTSSTLLRGVTRDNGCTPAPGPPACTTNGGGFTLRNANDAGCPGTTTPNECGSARLTNPSSARVIKWRQYGVSQRDWDSDAYLPELGDGHQNALDVCFGQANPGWDPRANNILSGQDADGDGLPAPCDPNDNQLNSDQDGDGWLNRLDNCPLVSNTAPSGGGGTTPNTFQLDRDASPATPVPDAGPRSDDIGPACDPNPTDPNGHYHSTVLVRTICIGGITPSDCSTSMDSDADGIANAFDNCISMANGPDRWGPPAGFAQSQRDFNADGFVDAVGEISKITQRFGLVGGLPGTAAGYDARVDLDYDDAIDMADLSLIIDGFAQSC